MSLLEQTKKQLRTDMEPGREYFANPDDYEAEIKTGIKWEVHLYGHVLLDEHCPYKQGQLTTIIGHTNIGKTYMILYLLTKLINKKRILIYSAENRISQIARILMRFVFTTNQFNDAHFKWLRERVLFIRHAKQFTYKELLEQVSIADDIDFKADIVFIDPYNSLRLERTNNTHEYHLEAIEDMRIFTMQTQKSIFLNCHTVTEAQRQKPNMDGETPTPMMSDVEGGGKFPNKSDDVWVLHRQIWAKNEEDKYTTMLNVGKVRNTEGGGRPTPFHEPIRFRFKKDWTGFTQDRDEVNKFSIKSFSESTNEPEWIK